MIAPASVPAADLGGKAQPLYRIQGLRKHFPLKGSWFGPRSVVRAVDDIDFEVRKGETLWKIAKRYGVSLQVLRAENGLGPRDAASPGKVLQVPSTERPAPAAAPREAGDRRPRNDARTYRIQKGDTLSRIARRMKISEAALRKANGFERNAALRVGRLITLP